MVCVSHVQRALLKLVFIFRTLVTCFTWHDDDDVRRTGWTHWTCHLSRIIDNDIPGSWESLFNAWRKAELCFG